jgi:hypothetical protein
MLRLKVLGWDFALSEKDILRISGKENENVN